MKVDKPIFFVGFPRSGTTVFFEAFSRHEGLGWPSAYTERFPNWPWINLLRRLLDNEQVQFVGRKQDEQGKKVWASRFLPRAEEAYSFWDSYSGRDFSRSFLLHEVADPNSRVRLNQAVGKILKWQARSRFAAKITGPSRMHFLDSLFPDARFVHVIRDGRAAVHSLLRTKFWFEKGGLQGPFWKGGLSTSDLSRWRESDYDPGILAALQWRRVVEVARMESQTMHNSRYTEVRYEEFVESPCKVLHELFGFLELGDSRLVQKYLDSGEPLMNMNFKYRTDLSAEYVEKLSTAMQPLLEDLNYS